MADGQILIDSRIQTDKAQQDTQDLKKTLESLADAASASAKNIKKSFDSLSIEDAAEGLGESFQKEAQEIKPLPDQIEKEFDDIDLSDVADGLADGFGEETKKTKEHTKDTEKAIEALTDKIKRQEKELGTLKTAYINARSEYGETADETQRLAREIEELSSDLSKSKKAFREAADAADQLDKSLDDIDPPEGLEGFMQGFIGGIASGLTQSAINLLEDAGRALVDFGKKSIGLASDLQEVQNVVDTAFPNMSKQVEEFAQSAISSAGLSETAAKQFMGTYGTMAKSFGFTEDAAFELSTTLTQLAGDVASFYNISVEEAYTKLMAVFTGETEALKELGVIMTETELNAYSMSKGIEKGTKGMGKQEKAALRLEYVMESLSAAQGDFVKTSGSWANQTKILAENWDSFSASIGEGLISTLTPAVQFINNQIMPDLKQMGDRFAEMTLGQAVFGDWILLLGGVGETAIETAGSVSQLTTEEQALTVATEEAYIAATKAMEQLTAQHEEVSKSIYDSLTAQIGYFDEIETKGTKTAKSIVENWKKQEDAFSRYRDNLKKAIEMNLPEELLVQLSDMSNESMLILDALVNGTEIGVDDIKDAFLSMNDTRKEVAETVKGITYDTAQEFANLEEQIRAEYGDMADAVLEELAKIQGGVDGLHGKDIYVNVITTTTSAGKTGGGAIRDQLTGAPMPYEAAAANIPYLASGAVIPPNAPFLAMLGDQRHGTNIEAPLSTIQEAVAQVIGDLIPSSMAGFEAVVAELQATRNAIEDIQIGDTTIGRAAARYDRRQNLIRGGSNA